jgi:hypothetical protein
MLEKDTLSGLKALHDPGWNLPVFLEALQDFVRITLCFTLDFTKEFFNHGLFRLRPLLECFQPVQGLLRLSRLSLDGHQPAGSVIKVFPHMAIAQIHSVRFTGHQRCRA